MGRELISFFVLFTWLLLKGGMLLRPNRKRALALELDLSLKPGVLPHNNGISLSLTFLMIVVKIE